MKKLVNGPKEQIIHVVKVDIMKEVILRTITTTQVIIKVFGLRPQTKNNEPKDTVYMHVNMEYRILFDYVDNKLIG